MSQIQNFFRRVLIMAAQGGGRRGGRGGRGGQGEVSEDVKVSKYLSWVLRHGAEKEKLPIDEKGFIPLKAILSKPKMKGYDEGFVQKIVDTNDKKRFVTERRDDGQLYIRAAQGHSIKCVNAEKFMKRITMENVNEYPTVVHGTYRAPWKVIERDGLCRMSRQHIHMAVGLPGENEVISGMRNKCQVVIHINLRLALEDGIPFYASENNVVLTPGIGPDGYLPSKYFEKVTFR